MPFRNNFFRRFEDRDKDIEIQQLALIKLFEESDDANLDIETNLQILDDLDLFAFSEITVNGKQTNALLEALEFGLDKMIDYCFDEGFINIRSILRRTNRYEVNNVLS